jgi:hypothetical protein
MSKQIVQYLADCAKHLDARGNSCNGTRFHLVSERFGAENEYRCATCGQILVGDEQCLAINRQRSHGGRRGL